MGKFLNFLLIFLKKFSPTQLITSINHASISVAHIAYPLRTQIETSQWYNWHTINYVGIIVGYEKHFLITRLSSVINDTRSCIMKVLKDGTEWTAAHLNISRVALNYFIVMWYTCMTHAPLLRGKYQNCDFNNIDFNFPLQFCVYICWIWMHENEIFEGQW